MCLEMPFYKWVIETGQSSRQKKFELLNEDVNAIANRRMSQAIQHLSQLAGIAYDIFGAIEDECVSIFKRTRRLKEKIRKCQGIVDNLNAKTVPVPVSSLLVHQGTVFTSRHVDAAIFSTFPRPPEVDRLRQLANGPSPIIPSTMIADGEPATHIYCQPMDKSLSSKGIMTSANKVPSSIVPIDVSGQTFSRMSSFRRSLIHVDFFIRRKKKNDKRRNTVTEGDTKELKEVLHNIINEKSQVETNTNNDKKISKHEQNHNMKQVESNTMKKIAKEEKNNNSSDKNSCSVQKLRNGLKLDPKSEEKNKTNTSKNENVTLDFKNHSHLENKRTALFTKRKTKGHIPISTVSAAMSVAVEMRQLNCKIQSEDHTSSGNWNYNSEPSESENRRNSTENKEYAVFEVERNNSALSKENSKNRLRDGCAMIPCTKPTSHFKAEISSCASSESNGLTGDETSSATESEVFFISSDESDEEISDINCEPNYGSSMSITTASNGSLNSLLSQTGTEMASSTGTLTSIGLDRLSPPTTSPCIELERLPTPPPPPPPTIITATVSNIIVLDKNTIDKNNIQNKKSLHVKNNKTSNKQIKPTQKSLKADELKSSTDSSKNIFTSLVGMKTRSKYQNKLKNSEKTTEIVNKPLFNMYGSDSPPNFKQSSSFIKEDISPVIKNESKNSMQSFSTCSINHKSKIQSENKPKYENTEHNVEGHMNLECDSTIPVGACNTEENNVDVPYKYTHKVTVTPIPRQSSTEQSGSLLACRKMLFKESEEQRVKYIYDSKHINNLNTFHVLDYNKKQFSYQKPKPQRPVTLQPQKPKGAARVLLDPEGRVVHCTNSLDRRIQHVSSSGRYNHTRDVTNQNGQIRNHGDEINKQIKFCNPNCNQDNHFKTPSTVHQFNNDMRTKRLSAIASINRTGYRPDTFETIEINPNNPSTLQQNRQEIMSPHQDINNYYYKTDNGVSTQKMYGAQSLPRQRSQLQRNPIVITPDPNISGLPSNDTLLTQYNVNLHSKQMGTFKMHQSNITSNCSEHSYSSLNKLESPVPTEVNKSPSAMSTEDLFAVIHSCKKKMNIKTDSDISLASSSRSNSPSYLRPLTSKGALAETGFLSPRNSSNLDSRDRRSWADFRPSKEIYGERKSLASDRLGPTKPTSMHDFKMLLLQTRSNSQVLGPRKSAVEMLKVPGPYERDTRIDPLTLILPSQNSSSHSVPNSPSSEFYFYNGHSTVPFKRNNRTRSTLQPRYTMYPPIFEDCSEDSENSREMLQNADKNIDAHKNPYMQHNQISLCENTSQNVRHWV